MSSPLLSNSYLMMWWENIIFSNQGESNWIDADCSKTNYNGYIQYSPICKGSLITTTTISSQIEGV